MKKILKKLFILLPSAIFLVIYFSIPEKITVVEGQDIKIFLGVSAKADTANPGRYSCDAKLFNIIPIKTVNVSVTPDYYVIPSGEAIGVRLHTEGVLVIGTGKVTDSCGRDCYPAKKAGLKEGDFITAVNNTKISNISELKRLINLHKDGLTLSVNRNDTLLNLEALPILSQDGKTYNLGIWARDSCAGIGTLTFYNPENETFAALGHGICDSDTGSVLNVRDGTVCHCSVNRIAKSSPGAPGEIIGQFTDTEFGDILVNCDIGIYGCNKSVTKSSPIPVASRFQITKGEAELICDIDQNGPTPYKIEITRISQYPGISNKSFTFKVTDEALINKTGGIVQGMSGSPVIQNGRLVGAVTHVFVNDSKKGYGIFAENMLDMTMQIK